MGWKEQMPKEHRYFETENGILYCGDCLEILSRFPKESVDLIVTDPPYLISYKTNHRKDKNHDFCKPIKNDDNQELIREFINIAYYMLKMNSAFYSFGSWKTVDFFKAEIEKYFKLKNIIVWVKNNWSAGDLKAQFGQQYELIFYALKGRRLINGKRLPDVWLFERVSGSKQLHQNEKPIKLLQRIIKVSSNDNELILDPFAGSGSTLVAAHILNRRWIGIEIEEKYCEIAKQRIENLMPLLNINMRIESEKSEGEVGDE
jgi:site-specific DNA-methyltransferase (adenine-specific)